MVHPEITPPDNFYHFRDTTVRVADAEVFDIVGYLAGAGWVRDAEVTGKNAWATLYRRGNATLRVHSRSGQGDVEATVNGRRIIAECKKGPLVKKPGSPEYPLLTTAIGQALLFDADDADLLVFKVPGRLKRPNELSR